MIDNKYSPDVQPFVDRWNTLKNNYFKDKDYINEKYTQLIDVLVKDICSAIPEVKSYYLMRDSHLISEFLSCYGDSMIRTFFENCDKEIDKRYSFLKPVD